MNEITWKLSNGKPASVTVELVLIKTINADGDKIDVPCCEPEIMAYVDGAPVGSGEPMLLPKSAPASIRAMGSMVIGKLLIPTDKYADVVAAINEAKSAPEWIAKVEAAKRAAKERDEYERGYRRVINAMHNGE